MSDMINNSFIMPIPIRVLHYFPAAMNHTLAYFTYAHQIHRREVASDRSSQMRVWTRVYHHRGLAIQELKSLVAREATGVPSDTAILSINQLLVTEILVFN